MYTAIFTLMVLLNCFNEVYTLKRPLFIRKVSIYYVTKYVFIIPWSGDILPNAVDQTGVSGVSHRHQHFRVPVA